MTSGFCSSPGRRAWSLSGYAAGLREKLAAWLAVARVRLTPLEPTLLNCRSRLRLFGPGPVPKDWKPDISGALQRIDASRDFVKPLVSPTNITSHGRDELKAAGLGLFHTTDWLKEAATSYAEVRRLRPGLLRPGQLGRLGPRRQNQGQARLQCGGDAQGTLRWEV